MTKTSDKNTGVSLQGDVGILPHERLQSRRNPVETCSRRVKLRDVCDIVRGEIPPKEQCGTIPVYNGGVTANEYIGKSNAQEGTIVVSAIGSTCGFVNQPQSQFWLGNNAYGLVSKIDTNYLYYRLKASQDGIVALRAGSGQPYIPCESLRDLSLTISDTDTEQHRIASALKAVDVRLDALSALAAKQEAIKKSTLSLLMRLEKKWGTMRLCEFGHFLSGSGFPISFQGEKSGDYPFCKVSDFNIPENSNAIVAANNYISRAVAQQLGCKIVPAGAIVFAKIGAAISLERKRLVKTSCCIDNNMMAFVSEKVSPDYCCQLLQQVRFQDLIEATALPSLSAKVVGNIAIPVPSLPEQRRIANSFAAIDEAIQQTRSERKKVESMKAGLMRYFFG